MIQAVVAAKLAAEVTKRVPGVVSVT